MAGDDVTITIRANSGDAVRAFRDVNGHLRDMRGRFASEGSIMSRSMNQVAASVGGVRGALIPLATAAVPLAAALTPIAVKAGAAGIAVGAFGAAVAGQVSHLSDAATAQDTYTDAVAKYGRGSKQAAESQRMLSSTLSTMPQATARAAVAMSTLKGEFHSWSDDLAGFTMTPVEKSFTLLGQLLPKLTPLAKGASSQLDRLVTVAGGAMASPGFDALSDKVSTFANRSLKEAVDGTIHFARALSEGQMSGPIKTFMEYAEKNGPALRETLANVGGAVMNLVKASSEAGPGMLTLVNAAAKLVASLPPELVATLMQTAVALKAVRLAGAGFAALSGGVQAFAGRLVTLRAASTAAGGGLTGLRAAFMSLGTAAKATIVVAGIAAVAVAFGKLGDLGREAPPNVDKLTTSLGQLGRTGKAGGEAARLFGKDLDGLYDSVKNITDPSTTDKIQQGLVKVFSLGMADSTPHSEAKGKLDAIDESLTNLVQGGKADVAAAGFKRLSQEYVAGGGSLKDFQGAMDGYSSALADSKFEQDLTADSMGVFGQAALATSAQLEAQTKSADGLRQSLIALNDVNRSAYDAQIGFEAALDGLTSAFKKNGATLDLNTEKGRANGTAMSQAAKSQDEFIAAGVAAGDSLGSMTKKSDELRETMMRLATDAFDGNKKKATAYVNTLLGAPSEIKTLVKLERQDAISGLKSVQAAIDKTPGAKKVTVSALNGAAIKALNAVGLKTKQLPDGKTAVYTANGKSLGSISSVRRALANLNGKTATTYVVTNYTQIRNKGYSGNSATGGHADGGLITGPGSGTSDSIPALLSNGEFVVNAQSTSRNRSLLEAINNGGVSRFAKGGKVTKAEAQARKDASGDLTISHFGSMAGYQRSEFRTAFAKPADVGSLVSALNQWRGIIKASTHGGQEKSLLRALDSSGKKLLSWEKQLTKVSASLEKAKDKLNTLKDSASQLASSVKSGILSSANITKSSGEGPVTVASIMGGLTQSRDKAGALSSALSQLKKKGLSSALIQQIAEAGVEGGGLETAGALLGASGSEIKSVNSLQGQINKSATSAGKTTADSVYAAAIKAQEKTVKSLTQSQSKLTKSMDKLAASMERMVEKAFKGKASGGIIGAASGGVRSGMTWVGEHEPELLDLPSGSRVWSGPDSRRMAAAPWASMLNTPRRGPAYGGAAAPAGRPEPFVLELRSSGSDVDEMLLKILRRAIRNRGSNVNVVLTGRK